MKRLVAFLGLFIYTCVSTGFAVRTHFCMDKQQSVGLGASKADVCSKCGMQKEENNGCCRDEVKVVKLEQDTRNAKLLMPSFELTLPVAFLSTYLLSLFYNFTQTVAGTAFGPPLHETDFCVANCVFRI